MMFLLPSLSWLSKLSNIDLINNFADHHLKHIISFPGLCLIDYLQYESLVSSNKLMKIEWPRWKIWKGDISSAIPLSEQISSDIGALAQTKGLHSKCQFSKSFKVVVQLKSICLIKPNFHVWISLTHTALKFL